MRISSIRTSQLVDEFRHVGGQIGRESERFAAFRVNEPQFRCVQRLTGEAERIEQRAERFGGASIDRVSQ